MRLIKPTKLNVKKFYKRYYSNNLEFKQLYKSIFSLIEAYPSQNKFSHILPKAIVINQLYSTNILAIKQMANHIAKMKLGNLIKNGETSVVEKIASNHGIVSKKKNTEYEFYSFATKYCHSHNPSKFPIYDGYVDFILWAYKKKDGFFVFKRNELKDYNTLLRVFKEFKKFYGLGKLSNNTLDKFLWKQGQLWFQ